MLTTSKEKMAAAQLQNRSFPAGRAAAQVGQNGGNKNQGCHLVGHTAAGMDCFNDHVGAGIIGVLRYPVQKGNRKTRKGQAEHDRGILCPVAVDRIQAECKGRTDKTDNGAGNHAHDQPFAQGEYQGDCSGADCLILVTHLSPQFR